MKRLRERRPRALVVDGEVLVVRVRESGRARTARIVVGPRHPLEIVVPRGVRDAEIDRMLAGRLDWIRQRVVQAREVAARPPALDLERSDALPLAGGLLPLERLGGDRSVAEAHGGRVVVRGPDSGVEMALQRWYRREARRHVEAAVEREGQRLGLRPTALTIRDQRTRWGSCSSRGTLSFSWRLVLAPPAVLDYVVVHELCHLREPNHAPAFWCLLDEALPGWPVHAGWLREHGRELHAFVPGGAVARGPLDR